MTRKPHTHPTLSSSAARSRRAGLGIGLLLVALVFLVFGRTVTHEFVNYDDEPCVYQNTTVSQGLSLENVGRAFTRVHVDNWHPLTTLSHMLDCQLFGLNPTGHHLHNVLLHAAASVLLFFMLRELTGATWRSAFVAALFAIHPLRVESVAWVSERKDVLSGVFFMLTLWAYARYARNPSSRKLYGATIVCFALGLMSKPMLVTVPFVMLLLDYWPLNRWQRLSQLPALLKKKVPFFALVLLSCVATVLAQQEAIQPLEHFSLALRMQNAVVAYAIYLGQWLWPVDLAVLYPMRLEGWPLWQFIPALLLLAGLSAGAWVLRGRQPFLLVGWLWFLGMLVPVIGILQVGAQSHADRYTYLPQIGIALAAVWTATELTKRWRWPSFLTATVAGLVLAALSILAHQQTSFWRDSLTLWNHTLETTQRNAIAHYNLGSALVVRGRPDEAVAHYRAAVAYKPNYAEAHYNLGNFLVNHGSLDAAVTSYRNALRYNPAIAEAHNNLANVLQIQNQNGVALDHYLEAVRLKPDYLNARYNAGNALAEAGRLDEAAAHYRVVLDLQPTHAQAHNNLGAVLYMQGNTQEALAHTLKALELQPDDRECRKNSAWMLATCPDLSQRNGPLALQLALDLSQSSGDNPVFLRVLAAAQAQTGDFNKAVRSANRALALARTQSDPGLAANLKREIKLYEAGRSFRTDP